MTTKDIAVIGMAGRFPGAANIDEYWRNLRDGVESIRDLPDEALKAAGVSEAELRDPAYVRRAPAFEGIGEFDAGFFGFSPRDASVMDPSHRQFLEVAWEAVEHAGRTALPDEGPIGVFAGSGAPYYLMDNVRRDRDLMRSMGEFLARHTGNDMNFLATRVSYEMDLRGPSVNIQTACSSALASVHMACESIRRGDCTMAIAGGSTMLVPDGQGYMYQEGEIMSPDGHCRPFDAQSAGTVFGSGVGAVVLRELSAALDAGDTIHAVIKGSAMNNDGAQRVGYLAPGVEGQARVVAMALDVADVPADSITYIEAHGTGTSVGDPIEVEALNQAFRARTDRRRFCALASVKSNIGHLGEAAGAASLIKAILSLKHRELPPSLGFERPNPQIDFDDSPFFVNDRLRPWDSEGPRRCGITSLGAGGTNVHVILEEAPEALPGEGARSAQLFVVSAKTVDALEQGRENLADALAADASLDLADAAYTLSVGRRPMPHRCAFVAGDRETAIRRLRDRDAKLTPVDRVDDMTSGVVFMFPGGGAQYPGMGAELYEEEPAYRAAVDECLAVVNRRLGKDLAAFMYAPAAERASAAQELERPSMSLPALFTTEYALASLFRSWGVEPVALLGHSMGEYVAACLSGVMTLDEALELVMLRGRLFETVDRGRMLSVPMSEDDLRAVLPEGLSIAAVNAPELCVASGPEHLIALLERTLAAREIEGTRVRIDVAAHSAMLDPILGEFRRFCRTIAWKAPTIPFLSNVTGQWITPADATDPEYWVRHLRSTVRFADCLETVRGSRDVVMLEVGPGRALSSFARAQRNPARHAITAMRHADEPTSALDHALLTVGRLWLAGVAVDWSAFYDGQLRNRVPLPSYAWDHQRHWVEAQVPNEVVTTAAAMSASGRREHVDEWFERPTWRQTLAPPALEPAEETVLLFAAGDFAAAVAQHLAAAGRRIVTVSVGDAFAQGESSFTIRPGALPDYERLLKSVVAGGGLPTRVVHSWTLAAGGGSRPFAETLELGFHSLLAFGQALSNEDPDARIDLDVITSAVQRVAGEDSLDPAGALALGPARVMPREFPNVRSRAIDILLPAASAARNALAGLVAAEIASEPTAETVAFRGRERFVQSLEPVRLDPVSPRMRRGGVYLVTGGLGGIGYALAEHLARTHAAQLVLVGRGASATRSREKIARLESLGASVEVVQADVTSVPQMRAAVERARERFGALNGVFHAAGTLGDSLMALKSREDAERVLAPKVHGTLAIDAAIGDSPLELFVLFSSISSMAGLAGQADYTAANAFLDAFAAERNTRAGGLTVAVNWSAWRDVGMAANIASGAGAGSGAGEDVHPVLGRRIWSDAEAELFASELSGSNQWVIGEHRLRNGPTLMPGTGYIEIVRAAVEARPEPRTVEIRDVTFMSPIVVADDTPREMRVRMARDASGAHALVIAARATTGDGLHVWQEHATATAAYVDDAPPAPVSIADIAARCQREERFTTSWQSVNMDFGLRWKNVTSIRYGNGEALVALELPPGFESDLGVYRLHPALLDMATGRCEAIVPGFNPATDFYVPLSYTRLRMFDGLPSRIFSHVRRAASDFDPAQLIVFDVTITDETGRVLVEIDEFVMTRVNANQLSGEGAKPVARRSSVSFEPPAAPSHLPPLIGWIEEAIRPDEGMQAIEHIVAGPALSQVYATPRPVMSLVTEMRRPQAPAAKAEEKEPVVSLVRIADAESRLSAHPAVQQAIVLERFDRTGKRHVVGYVLARPGEHPTVSELRRFVKKDIAAGSVPGTIILVESIPVSAGGEPDLAALHDPFALADDYVAPRTETENVIAGIWKDALGVKRVGVRDNFFDIGGHSLLAVRAVVKIDKALGVRLNQAIMVLQTLEQIAAEVDRQRTGSAPPAAGGDSPPPEPPVEQESSGFFRSIRNAVAGRK